MYRRVAIGAVVVLAGCHAGTASAPPPTSPTGRFTIVERAESKPVTALAVAGPHLWAGGGAGLRRIERRTGEYEIVGGPGVPGGHDIAALSIDEAGAVWVSTPAAVGRWVISGGTPRYEGHGAPGPVTVLAAGRPVARAGVWAGGPKGLYWFDGHGWVTVVALRDVAVTTLTLDESGSAVWVGTAARGVFRAEGEGATPVTSGVAVGAGGEAIVLTPSSAAHIRPAARGSLPATRTARRASTRRPGRGSRATAGRGASRSPAFVTAPARRCCSSGRAAPRRSRTACSTSDRVKRHPRAACGSRRSCSSARAAGPPSRSTSGCRRT